VVLTRAPDYLLGYKVGELLVLSLDAGRTSSVARYPYLLLGERGGLSDPGGQSGY
jgi:hypothetical protein